MGGGQFGGVEDFAVGSQVAVETWAVPRGNTFSGIGYTAKAGHTGTQQQTKKQDTELKMLARPALAGHCSGCTACACRVSGAERSVHTDYVNANYVNATEHVNAGALLLRTLDAAGQLLLTDDERFVIFDLRLPTGDGVLAASDDVAQLAAREIAYLVA